MNDLAAALGSTLSIVLHTLAQTLITPSVLAVMVVVALRAKRLSHVALAAAIMAGILVAYGVARSLPHPGATPLEWVLGVAIVVVAKFAAAMIVGAVAFAAKRLTAMDDRQRGSPG